jgi:LysM repeat protein
MKRKIMIWSVLTLAVLLLGIASQWTSAAPLAQQQNLLVNPGFEGINCPSSGWCPDNYTRDTFTGAQYGEIYTPQGWVTFWSEGVNPADGRHYGRPECKVIPNAPPFVGPPARVRSGNYAIMQFGFWRSIDSGVYQTVSNLSPGATVQASAYAHTWTCNDDQHGAMSCDNPDDPNVVFRVGIDPNGGTDPWSPNVVWASGFSRDTYRLIGPVQATVGESGRVTVFLRATAKWPFKHNDVYWDDAALVYTSPPATATPAVAFCSGRTGTYCDGNALVVCSNGTEVSRQNCANGCQSMPAGMPDVCASAATTSGFCSGRTGTYCDGNALVVCTNGVETRRQNCPSGCQSMPSGVPDVCVGTTPSAPAATATPRPEGAVVHVVRSGDTLSAIALQYGVTVEQIRQLNGMAPGDNTIVPGQELLISGSLATPTPTTPAEPPTPTPTPTPQTGSICVAAFHDRNGDTFQQSDTEELLPNAVFSVGDATGMVGQYTTDGLSEPYCFLGLLPGTYRVTMQPPVGYTNSGPSYMAVVLSGPAQTTLAMGAQRSGTPTAEETPGAVTTPTGGGGASSTLSNVLRWAARIGGILLLIVAIGIAVVFFLSRRPR